MKDFFKYVFATVVGILVVGLLSFIMMMVSLLGMTMQSTTTVPSKSVMVMKLSGEMTERSQDNPFASLLSGSSNEGISLSDALKAIDAAKDNDDVKGIYIEAGSLGGAAPAMLEELRAKLVDFKKSGKFIMAYGDTYTQGTYYLSSVADSVVINPSGMLEWVGLGGTVLYYKDLMDKVGVKAEVFKVGTYKSAVEPYITNEMSDANREQITVYSSEIWKKMREDIAKSRKQLTAEKLNVYADSCIVLSDATEYLKAGMVDKLAYPDEVKQMLARYMEVDDPKDYHTISIADMAKASSEKAKDPSGNIVAVYYASGEIVEEEEPTSLLSGGERIVGQKVIKDLEKLANDDDVKAVVLRVNSPGGSAYASEQIWHQLMKIKEKKPLVVSMGGYAASGGYYISCPADWIVAEPTTITGSIGIFGMFFNGNELLEKKMGLKSYSVKTNEYGDFGAGIMGLMLRDMTPNERTHLQSYINRGYELFTKRVADGRKKEQDYIKTIGEGRVWTGVHAKGIGLVDQLGGLDVAIEEAKKRAKLEKCSVMNYPAEENLFSKLMDTATNSDSYADARARELFGEYFEILTTVKSVTSKSGVQASLPYIIDFNL
ncbi:MAG: signal peptide peptidase SppA [Bacteroidaceae bacterium]|nr:signal peptide peptidase SppA [Bacteroidaceae bacterium]